MNLDGRTRVAVVVLRTGLSGSLAVQRGISDCAKGFTSQLESELLRWECRFHLPFGDGRTRASMVHKVNISEVRSPVSSHCRYVRYIRY